MMKIDPHWAGEFLVERYKVDLTVRTSKEGTYVRPSDFPVGRGFAIRITSGWRRISAEFIPENLSGSVMEVMAQATQDRQASFKALVAFYVSRGLEIQMYLNGTPIDLPGEKSWPTDWKSVRFTMTKHSIIPEELGAEELGKLGVKIAGYLLSIILSLLLTEEFTKDDANGLPEGAVVRVEVNRYERSSTNRAACILIHGCSCQVCGFAFETTYGSIGKDFIHVHHVIPVSQLGPDYVIDPQKDLVPVCPNCHAMLHRKEPPYTVDELRELITGNGDSHVV